MEKEWNIRRYADTCKQEWDGFVASSRNGTFLFMRDYMDYHADRFHDFSLMAYYDGKLRALLPAHITDDSFCSHNGLTYGGFISDPKMTTSMMLELFEAVMLFVRAETHTAKWIYRTIPYIYARYPSDEDLYALYRFGGILKERKVSTVIPVCGDWGFSELRRRKVKKARKQNYSIKQDCEFSSFWNILEDTLKSRHQTHPVHSLDEICRLQQSFPENIVLYRVCDATDETVAGCVMYVTEKVAHVQYIASTAEGRINGALDFLFDDLIHRQYRNVPYFDMGTSVEKRGLVLNEGLIFQKEGFGGRAVMYDAYELTF